MSQWDMVRSSFERAHDDLFEGDRYHADFFNYSQGSYNPDEGEIEGETRSAFAKDVTVEIVPPGQDSTVDNDGTSMSWTTSIRFPQDRGDLTVGDGETYTIGSGESENYDTVTVETGGTLVIDGSLYTEFLNDNGTVTINGTLNVLNATFSDTIVPLGEDNERPTEVEIVNQKDGSTERFELHSYTPEIGSGFIMARLIEQ